MEVKREVKAMQKIQKKTVTVRLAVQDIQAIKEIAAKENYYYTELIRLWIKQNIAAARSDKKY